MSKLKLGANGLKEKLAAQVAQQAAQGMKNPLREVKPADFSPHSNASINLRVFDVLRYEHDPRTRVNEKYEEIKASVKARGIEHAIYITKRPGSDQWVIAKGGNTRLAILHDLATENPDKWLYHDFLIKPYSKESDLLASHLIENLQRSDMTFWDTAKGLMVMRDEMEKELVCTLTPKQLAENLKGKGLDFQEATLSNYQFAIEYFSTLGDFSHKLALDHIRTTFRPQFAHLSAIAAKAAEGDTEGFDTLYRFWIESYPTEHKTYDCGSLQKHIHSNACRYLDVSEEELSLMIEGYKRNSKASLEELRTPPPPATPPAFTPPDAGTDGEHDDSALDTHPDPADDSGSAVGLANLTATLGGTAGAPVSAGETLAGGSVRGLRVASGLTPIDRNAAINLDEQADSTANQETQRVLSGMSALESAHAQLQASLHEFADTAGISGQLLPAPGMPLGFYMELPKAGMLGTSAELPLQAWWFLANLSGQVESDIDATLDKIDAAGDFALPDSGPNGFRHALAEDAQWAEAVEQCLGGEPLNTASSVFTIVTDAMHPLCDPAMQLIAHIRNLRLNQAEAASGGAR